MRIKIGTRGSRLALVQTREVIALIRKHFPAIEVKVAIIKTTGDRIYNRGLYDIPGKGLFIKEIEAALIEKRIDLAVHSMKDVPTEMSEGLVIGAVTKREEPGDVLITLSGVAIEQLSEGAKIGTSSLRRKAQVLALRPDLQIIPIRGNVDTRIKKMKRHEVDGIIVAAAGIKRLGIKEKGIVYLPYETMLPAPGQGALALQVREGELGFLTEVIDDSVSHAEVKAERALLRYLGGGCHTPIGCLARAQGNKKLLIRALVCNPDGTRKVADSIEGDRLNARQCGEALAQSLLAAGADSIIKNLGKDGDTNHVG